MWITFRKCRAVASLKIPLCILLFRFKENLFECHSADLWGECVHGVTYRLPVH